MLKTLYIGCLSLLFYLTAFGQMALPDTIINLEQVTVKGSRQTALLIGHTVEPVDSADRLLMPAATLADLVSGMPSLHIKNYGSGTLTTISLRGTSANHTGLVWNGIPITPPNIGYPDLSFVRGDFFNGIRVLYGGASPVYGSGHIGGTIEIANQLDTASDAGSFSFGTSAGKLTFPSPKAVSRPSSVPLVGYNPSLACTPLT